MCVGRTSRDAAEGIEWVLLIRESGSASHDFTKRVANANALENEASFDGSFKSLKFKSHGRKGRGT